MNSLIVLIMLVFLAVGIGYGVGAKTITTVSGGVSAVTKTFAGLSGLIFLLFVISQFLAYFDYSNIATIVAVDLGEALEHVNLGAVPLLLGFIAITGAVGVLIVGANSEMGNFCTDLCAVVHEARDRARSRAGCLQGGQLAAERRLAADALFRADCRLRAALPEDKCIGTVVAMMLPYAVAISVVWILYCFSAGKSSGCLMGPVEIGKFPAYPRPSFLVEAETRWHCFFGAASRSRPWRWSRRR